MDSQVLRVEDIMNEIKSSIGHSCNPKELISELNQEIIDQGLKNDILDINEAMDLYLEKRLKECLAYLEGNCEVRFYRELDSKNKIVFFIKRVIRKIICFCVKPMAEDQSHYNFVCMQILSLQAKKIESLTDTIECLEKNINIKQH